MIIIWGKGIFSSSFPACLLSCVLLWQEARRACSSLSVVSFSTVAAAGSALMLSFLDHFWVSQPRPAPPPPLPLAHPPPAAWAAFQKAPHSPKRSANPIPLPLRPPRLALWQFSSHFHHLPPNFTIFFFAVFLHHLHNTFFTIFFEFTYSLFKDLALF